MPVMIVMFMFHSFIRILTAAKITSMTAIITKNHITHIHPIHQPIPPFMCDTKQILFIIVSILREKYSPLKCYLRLKNFIENLLLSALLVYISVEIHEFGHWLVLWIFGHEPVMSFNGLVQLWDTIPNHPDEWVKIYYPGIGEGWLRLSSLPSNNLEWILMLLAGPIMHPILILVGILFMRINNAFLQKVGVMLVLINGLKFLTNLLSYFQGAIGDYYFIGVYSGIPHIYIVLLFVIVQFLGFAYGIYKSGRLLKEEGASLLISIFLAGIIIITLLSKLNGLIVEGVDNKNPFFMPILGWPLPVLIVNILSLVMILSLYKRSTSPDKLGA